MIPSENDLLGASQPLHSHNHLSSPLRSLSHSHTRTLPPLYISRISHSHIHTTTYIPDGPSAFWTFSFVFALRGRGNQQLEERVQQLSLLEDDWMEQRSNRINFVTSCGQKPHAQIYRKAYDGEQTCINGVKRLTEHGFLSSTLYLFFFFCLSLSHFCVSWLCINRRSSSYLVFFSFLFSQLLFPYVLAAGLCLKNLHFQISFCLLRLCSCCLL
jgi:hypothetical protein